MENTSFKEKIITELGFTEIELGHLFEKCNANTEAKEINFLMDLKSLLEYRPDNDFFIKACIENLIYNYDLNIEVISKLTNIEKKPFCLY